MQGVGTDIISKSLGHHDGKITKANLKELEIAILDKASEFSLQQSQSSFKGELLTMGDAYSMIMGKVVKKIMFIPIL